MSVRHGAIVATRLLPVVLMLSACGPSAANPAVAPPTTNAGAAAGGSGMIDKLYFGAFGGGDNPQLNYNPYSPNALSSAYTFESLMVVNNYTCEVVPWLATAYNWVDPQTLAFTMRDGVKWSDGQPFSGDDVVFSLNLLKQQPAFDKTGVWQTLNTVTSSGNTVTFNFTAPAVNMLQRVASVLVVPQHVWSAESDPVKFTNAGAVGTGPFKPSSFNGEQLVLDRNATYWQADKIQVNQLIFNKNAGGNQVEQLALSQGKYDTNSMFVPNIKQVYIDKDPQHNHYWFPQGGLIGLGLNLTKPPFNDVEFRRGVAYAIDRQAISTKAQFGYVQPASQTGLVLPGQKDWLAADTADQGMIPYDVKQAGDILDKAGYTKDANGKRVGKDGTPIAFTFLVQSGYTDWIQAAQVVQQDLDAVGLTMNVQTPAPDAIDQQRGLGNFDMTFAVHGGSCSMYDNYHDYFYSKASAPVGQVAPTNWIRWMDPATDGFIDQLRQSPDVAVQKQAVAGLQQIMVTQFPTVPLWYGGHWFEYSTRRATGWPNEADPYASTTDNLLIITHLKPSPDYKPGQ